MKTFKCNHCGDNCTVVTDTEYFSGCKCLSDEDWANWIEVIPFNDDLFNRPDIPNWAKYAAVQPDGHIIVYSSHPRWDSDQDYWVPTNYGGSYKVLNVLTDADVGTLLEKQETKLSESIKPGDWLLDTSHSDDDRHYWQVKSIDKDTGHIRICRYGIDGYRHHDYSPSHFYDSKYKPVKVNPVPAYEAHNLVGNIVRDRNKNVSMITDWCEEQGKLYMNMHAVTLDELTNWWLSDRPCGFVQTEDDGDDDIE